jgi:hypothetical protein
MLPLTGSTGERPVSGTRRDDRYWPESSRTTEASTRRPSSRAGPQAVEQLASLGHLPEPEAEHVAGRAPSEIGGVERQTDEAGQPMVCLGR